MNVVEFQQTKTCCQLQASAMKIEGTFFPRVILHIFKTSFEIAIQGEVEGDAVETQTLSIPAGGMTSKWSKVLDGNG